MTANNTHRGNQLRPVQFSRLPKRGVLLGLSLAQLVTLAIGLVAFTSAVYMGFITGRDESTPEAVYFEVDWVRVYKREG